DYYCYSTYSSGDHGLF
nr:immunoglobulin light chain junction region [Macaca mulatta]MOX37630.1 immunoglobulin light chain junction region [Macaca mulatta]